MADPHIEDRDTTWVRTAKDLFSGAAGGVAQVLLGIMNSLLFVLSGLQYITVGHIKAIEMQRFSRSTHILDLSFVPDGRGYRSCWTSWASTIVHCYVLDFPQ